LRNRRVLAGVRAAKIRWVELLARRGVAPRAAAQRLWEVWTRRALYHVRSARSTGGVLAARELPAFWAESGCAFWERESFQIVRPLLVHISVCRRVFRDENEAESISKTAPRRTFAKIIFRRRLTWRRAWEKIRPSYAGKKQ
jgi:hypothetical protein